jgi:hypothetical protein
VAKPRLQLVRGENFELDTGQGGPLENAAPDLCQEVHVLQSAAASEVGRPPGIGQTVVWRHILMSGGPRFASAAECTAMLRMRLP